MVASLCRIRFASSFVLDDITAFSDTGVAKPNFLQHWTPGRSARASSHGPTSSPVRLVNQLCEITASTKRQPLGGGQVGAGARRGWDRDGDGTAGSQAPQRPRRSANDPRIIQHLHPPRVAALGESNWVENSRRPSFSGFRSIRLFSPAAGGARPGDERIRGWIVPANGSPRTDMSYPPIRFALISTASTASSRPPTGRQASRAT